MPLISIIHQQQKASAVGPLVTPLEPVVIVVAVIEPTITFSVVATPGVTVVGGRPSRVTEKIIPVHHLRGVFRSTRGLLLGKPEVVVPVTARFTATPVLKAQAEVVVPISGLFLARTASLLATARRIPVSELEELWLLGVLSFEEMEEELELLSTH